MINLMNDYCAIAHEKVLEALVSNSKQTFVGYGLGEKTKNVENFFPVGKIDQLYLWPLNFEEYLINSNEILYNTIKRDKSQ